MRSGSRAVMELVRCWATLALAMLLIGCGSGSDDADDLLSVKVFRDCGQCPEMVMIPAGSLLMDSPSDEEGGNGDEGLQHRVEIESFAVGKYEVSFAEWDACRSAGGCSRNPDDRGWGRGNRPVINVSWEDAQEYVRWLSRETGKGYRLLTEAEWEYAARAGTTTSIHTDVTISTDEASYDGDHIYGSESRDAVAGKQTVEVGSLAGNAFGLHDMDGNVWEWLEDCGHESHEGAPVDGSAWKEGGDCGARLLRGGTWSNDLSGLLGTAYRLTDNIKNRNLNIGFRVARTLTP